MLNGELEAVQLRNKTAAAAPARKIGRKRLGQPMLVADGNEDLSPLFKDNNKEGTGFKAKQYDNVALLLP